VSTDLRAQLQSTLGTTYSIERELGGGGMSRVFVARDETLGRDVPHNSRTDAVWRRFHLDPARIAQRAHPIAR
jgi:hypothetical protein